VIRLLFSFMKRFGQARGTALLRVAGLTGAILAFSTSGFMFFELENKPDLLWSDALWWSVVTMTTVGYGDYFPTSPGGRFLIGFPTMIFGISVLGYLLSTVASFLIEARSKELKGMGDSMLEDHILVFHFSSKDRLLGLLDEMAGDLMVKDKHVLLVDPDLEELPAELAERGVKFVSGNPIKEATLERANFKSATHAIILARDPTDPASDNHNLAVTLTLEQLYPDIVTVSECVDPESIPLLYKAGADSVVCLAEMSASVLVSEVSDPGVQDVLLDLASNDDDGQQLYIVPIQGGASFDSVKKAVEQRGHLAVGLMRGKDVLLNPGGSASVQSGDRAICVAPERPTAISA
jgi:voltage-gated potassium channel